ncbi:MAG: sugar phosphate isomerase/epimerase family protein [Pseudomonadota bacterium]
MKPLPFTLAMSNIAWAPDERLDAYRLMANAGLTSLEIAPGLFFHAADNPFVPDKSVADQAVREAEAFGLRLVSMQSLLFGVAGAALFEGHRARATLVEGMRRAIDLAGRFEIPNLVFGSPGQRNVPDTVAMDRARDEAAQVFHDLADYASKAGTRIAFEPNPAAYGTNFVNTLDEALAFIERVNHPALVPILDLGAMHMNGEFHEVPTRAPALASRLSHVHISEPNLDPAPARAVELAPVLSALGEAGYTRAVSIEMKRPEGGLAEVEAALSRLIEATRSHETQEASHA